MIAAYRPSPESDPDIFLPFILPVLISSIQTNSFLDESLAVLTRTLHLRQSKTSLSSLSPHITVPLCGLLPAVASSHADPLTRHQAFRVLSLLLVASEPQLRFRHLVELTSDSEFPQMRVASVGLVKEALLEALSLPPPSAENIFLTSLFLRSFGTILFRPNPSDLFTSANLTLSEFQDSHEPQRLVECLALYYVLLLRDKSNLVCSFCSLFRNSSHTEFLIRLYRLEFGIPVFLELLIRTFSLPWKVIWNDGLRMSKHRQVRKKAFTSTHLSYLTVSLYLACHHDITPIVSLEISLERVDFASRLVQDAKLHNDT